MFCSVPLQFDKGNLLIYRKFQRGRSWPGRLAQIEDVWVSQLSVWVHEMQQRRVTDNERIATASDMPFDPTASAYLDLFLQQLLAAARVLLALNSVGKHHECCGLGEVFCWELDPTARGSLNELKVAQLHPCKGCCERSFLGPSLEGCTGVSTF